MAFSCEGQLRQQHRLLSIRLVPEFFGYSRWVWVFVLRWVASSWERLAWVHTNVLCLIVTGSVALAQPLGPWPRSIDLAVYMIPRPGLVLRPSMFLVCRRPPLSLSPPFFRHGNASRLQIPSARPVNHPAVATMLPDPVRTR